MISSTVLKLQRTVSPHGTHDIPTCVMKSPTVLKITPTVPMRSPTVLKISPNMHHDPPWYCTPPRYCTHVIQGDNQPKRKKILSDKKAVSATKPRYRILTHMKATFHSTIFDILMHPLRENQKHRHRFTR